MEKSFTIKLHGKTLASMEKLSKTKYRSTTQQIYKIINDFVIENPVELDDIKKEKDSKKDPDDVF